jgi:hypothetical protein
MKQSARLLLIPAAALVVGCSSVPSREVATVAVSQPVGLSFAVSQLVGSWAESANHRPVCTSDEVRYRFEFSSDGRRVTVKLNKIHPTEIGDKDEIGATIIESTANTLTIAYDGESRLRDDGKPMQWQLVVVSQGVYRWREASWPVQAVNPIVGVRCAASAA